MLPTCAGSSTLGRDIIMRASEPAAVRVTRALSAEGAFCFGSSLSSSLLDTKIKDEGNHHE